MIVREKYMPCSIHLYLKPIFGDVFFNNSNRLFQQNIKRLNLAFVILSRF